jgi:hypothetical protein
VQEFGSSCTGNRNECKATDPFWGRAWRVSRGLSLRAFATVATRRRGENKSLTLQRPQARPARFLPRGGTGTRAVRFNEAGAGAQGARRRDVRRARRPRLTGRHWRRNWRPEDRRRSGCSTRVRDG